jgi:hypothetical protein
VALTTENATHSSDEYEQVVERWFHALHQREIDTDTDEWVAQVAGIHVDGQEIWIQIAAGEGPGEEMLLLHVSAWTTVDQAIAALKAASFKNDSYPRVVTALPTLS